MARHEKIELDSDNIGKLLIKFSIPAIMALMIQSLYNLIDTIYVGHGVGSAGIASLTIFFPVQMIVVSIANLASIGGGALISIHLGKKNFEYSNRIAANVVLLIILIGIALTFINLFFIKPLLTLFGSTEHLYPYLKDYALVAFSCIIFTLLLQGLYCLLRAEGKLKLIMKTTIASVLLNIALNPLFLFVFDMGMRGVSIATVLSQIVVLIVIIRYYIKGNTLIKFKLKYFYPNFHIIYRSCLLGTSSLLRMCGNSVINILINRIAGEYGGVEGIASFGLAFRLIIFLFMPILGFIQGGQPLIGFNYGSGKIHKVKKIINYSLIITISFSSCFILIVYFLSDDIIPIFTNNITIIRDSSKYFKLLILALPFIAYQAIISGYLQAVGRVMAANIVTVVRQFLFFTPIMLILSSIYKMNGLSSSYIISNFISFTIIFIWMRKEKRINLYSE